MFKKFLLAAALTACFSAQAPAQDSGPCIIQSVEGRAFVSTDGITRQAAVVNLKMGTNATLRTSANARVILQCTADLQVIVGPETDIAVAELVPGGSQPVALRLLRGIAGFLFDGDGDGVQVHTPSAVAAVRSTQWAMRVENRASAIFARQGAVFVLGDAASVRLVPGEGVDVTAHGKVGNVVRWGQKRIDLFANLLGPGW